MKKPPALYVAVWTVDSDPEVLISRTEAGLSKKLWAAVRPWWDTVNDGETPRGRKYDEYITAYFNSCAEKENGEYVEYLTYTEKDIT
jgi:hypothetical protein